MAASTTPEAVEAIVETELNVAPFIATAEALYAAQVGNALPDALGSQVLAYLAAHFVAVTDPRERQEAVATGSWSFEGKQGTGTGLASTQFGQMAMSLDTTGKLRKVDKVKARLTVL